MNIIGLSGVARSGKDTTADILVREHHFVKVALADPMKHIVQEVFPTVTDDELWGPSEGRNRPLGNTTLRVALQKLGTEWGRSIDENVWVDCALRQAEKLLGRSGFALGVVIPDVRYPNELAAIRKVGGVVWRVVRPGAGLTGEAAKHISESSLDDGMVDFDGVVLNNDSLDTLRGRIAAMMKNGRPYCG